MELLTKILVKMEWDNLHELLRSLYDDMMPLAGDMAAVAVKGFGGIGSIVLCGIKGLAGFKPCANLLICFLCSVRLH